MKKNIKFFICTILGAGLGTAITWAILNENSKKKIRKKNDHANKMREFYYLLLQWLGLWESGKSILDYFRKNNYKTIAIYGMKELGERLYEELRDSDVEVKYVIDKNADNIYAEVDVVSPDDGLGDVDVVVVTATHYYNEIAADLEQKLDCPIISLEDVIYES